MAPTTQREKPPRAGTDFTCFRQSAMLRQFDPKAIDYAPSDEIESLADLVGHEPGAVEAFFKKTYVTGGMRTLLRQGLQGVETRSAKTVRLGNDAGTDDCGRAAPPGVDGDIKRGLATRRAPRLRGR